MVQPHLKVMCPSPRSAPGSVVCSPRKDGTLVRVSIQADGSGMMVVAAERGSATKVPHRQAICLQKQNPSCCVLLHATECPSSAMLGLSDPILVVFHL